MVQRVMMIAGEASGDLHGSAVVRELRKRIPGADIYGIGGENMRSEGMEILHHNRDLSVMGFLEVVRHLGTVRRVERYMTSLLTQRPPDVVVLIDYPGFNLRFARIAKRHGVPVLYYISPQIWAWHRSRIRRMKGVVDRMKVVFPFEVEMYQQEGIDAEFVGHPLAERIGSSVSREEFCRSVGLDSSRKILGLFPGSRVQEIEHIFPVMVEAATRISRAMDIQPAVGVAPNLDPSVIQPYLSKGASIAVVRGATYDLMAHADAAAVTSGTATLEAGWFGTPMVVVYRTSTLTYWIGRMLVNVPYIGLVNIVAGKKVVPELTQYSLTAERLQAAVERLICDLPFVQRMKEELKIIKHRLGVPGASSRVAEGIIALGNSA